MTTSSKLDFQGACWNDSCIRYGQPQRDSKTCSECKSYLHIKPLIPAHER